MRQALVLSFAEATAGAAAIVATVVYVRDTLGRSDSAFTFVMAGLGVGSAVTALILGRITSRYEQAAKERDALHTRRHVWARRALIIGGVMLGLLLLPGVLKPSLILFAVLWFLNGAGQALIAIPSSTLLAEHTREEERGRAYAAHFALTHACWLVTYPATGYAAAQFGTPLSFTVAGVVCLVVTLAALVVRRGVKDETHIHEHSEAVAPLQDADLLT